MSKVVFEQARQFYEAGNLDRARSLCHEMLGTMDQSPISVIELLCQIEHQAGRFDVALQHSDVLVSTKPEHAGYRSNRATLLGKLDRTSEVVGEYQRLLAIEPDHLEANLNLGAAYLRLSRAWAATQHLAGVVQKFPTSHKALFMYAKALVAMGDYQRALPEIEKTHRLLPGNLEIAMMFADVKASAGDVEGAIRLYRQLLSLHPNHLIRIKLSLGNAYGYRGDIERAVVTLRECLEIDPNSYSAARSLTLVEKNAPDSRLAKKLLMSFREKSLGHLERSQIAFALANIFDRAKSFHQASAYFRSGNRSLRTSMIEQGSASELPVHQQTFEISRSTLKRIAGIDWSSSDSVADRDSFTPVFIVGMPRSGSTMMEQIIGAHSKVASAGEVTYLSIAFTDFVEAGRQSFPRQFDWPDLPKSLEVFAERYMQQASRHRSADGSAFVTDKWLYNFLRVGLIRKVFPRSKIIWCVREPRDCVVSIFNTHFAKGHLYTTDFDSIAEFYALHDKALKHWQETFPGQFYVQSYESMVASPETEVRGLLDYCGLPMEEACLNFHQRDNSVLTASMTQVRKPINSNSVARWQRYESYQPALDNALKRHGILPE